MIFLQRKIIKLAIIISNRQKADYRSWIIKSFAIFFLALKEKKRKRKKMARSIPRLGSDFQIILRGIAQYKERKWIENKMLAAFFFFFLNNRNKLQLRVSLIVFHDRYFCSRDWTWYTPSFIINITEEEAKICLGERKFLKCFNYLVNFEELYTFNNKTILFFSFINLLYNFFQWLSMKVL